MAAGDRRPDARLDLGRKIAAILLAPKAKDWYWDGRDGSPACESAVVAAIGLAEKILRMIDSTYPKMK